MFFTFYSYKGGVGRTMALANVAKWLSLQGLRVAMIDWDLEAPGLESFFFQGGNLEEVRNQLGLIDLLVSYRRLFPRIREKILHAGKQVDDKVAALQAVLPPVAPSLHRLHEMGHSVGEGGALYLLSAGWRAGEKFAAYAQAVQEFNWDNFYQEYEGEAYFEWLRGQLLAPDLADVVLVDSRTGVTEMGGVCTRQLADVVVILSAPNLQNIEGVLSMAHDITRPDLAVRRGRPVRVVMVPSRVDNTAPARVNAFMEQFAAESQPFTPEVFRTLKSTFWTLRVPYAPTYAYQERLAIGESDADKDLEESYKRLAVHLAMLAAPQKQIRRRLAGEIERVFGKLLPTVFVDYAQDDREAAMEIRRRFEEANISVWPDAQDSLAGGADWRQAIGAVLEQTRFLVVVATPGSLRSPSIRQQWRRARELGVWVVPVAPAPLPQAELDQLPGWMRQATIANLDPEWPRIVALVSGPNTSVRAPMMAPDVSDLYVSRQVALRRLFEHLVGGSVGRVALYGLPGCGKTALAAAFCRSDEAQTAFPDGVVWVSAGKDADAKAELEKVYAALTGDDVGFADLREARARVESRMSGRRCLFVLDDAWSAETVAAYPLEIKGCRYLVTTSDRAVAARAEAVPIDVGALSDAEAEDVLRRAVPEAGRGLALDHLHEFSTRFGAFPQTLRLAAAGLGAAGSVTEAIEAPLSPEILKAFDKEVLARLDEEMRERLVLLTFAAGDTAVPPAELHPLWSTDPAGASRTVNRLADLSLVEVDPASGEVRVNPWVRQLVARRFHDRDRGKMLEASYGRLDPADRDLAREVLCRLVRVTEGPDGGVKVEPEPAPLAVFSPAQRAVAERLASLNVVAKRVTAAASCVSLAEPSSVHQWPRLRDWIKADSTFLLWRQRLTGYLADWRRTSDEGALLSGILLEEAQRWVTTRRGELSDEEVAYVERSAQPRTRPATGESPVVAAAEPRRSRRLPVAAVVAGAVVVLAAFVWYAASHSGKPAVPPGKPSVAEAPNADKQVLEGDLLAERGDLAGAVRAYTAALAAGGENASVLFKRGTAWCRTATELDKCIADLEQAHKLAPARADVLAALANARLQKDQVDEALKDLDAAIELDPKSAALYASRAAARERVNRPADALKDYSTALELDPSLSDAWFSRARLYEAAGNRARAVADLEKVVALNAEPTSVRAAQARLKRLGGVRTAPAPAVTTVYLHYVAPEDRPALENLRAAIVKRGFRVAGIQWVKGGRTYGDVRYVPQDATVAASIGALVESTLADSGYDVPIERIALRQPEARPGVVEVWVPPLSLPSPRQQKK